MVGNSYAHRAGDDRGTDLGCEGLAGDIYLDETIELDVHRQHVVVTPFPAADQSLVLDVDPERVVVQSQFLATA